MEILITPSTHEENVFFIFRPIDKDNCIEIKLYIDFYKEMVKASHPVLPDEMNYIRQNFFCKEIEKKQSILNFREFDMYSTQKTYKSIA